MSGGNRGVTPGLAVAAIGASLLVASLVHVLYFHLPSMRLQTDPALTDPALLVFKTVELAFLVLPPAVLVYVAFRLPDGGGRPPSPGQWRIVGWCVLGALSAPLVIGAIKIHQFLSASPIDPTLVQMELLTGASVGGVLGLVIGSRTARAASHSRRVMEQQEAFVFLNRALRHHVLNSLNVVIGYARLGRDRLPEGDREVLDPAVHRSESIVALIENVGRIAETYTGELAGEPLDVVSILADEIEASRTAYEYARFDTALPEHPVYVRGNEALRIAFENVLTNAVEHNDRQSPSVRASVETDRSTIRIRIEDDGPGIPETERDRLFEPRENGACGFGLYLANEIVEYHGGSISLEGADPRGTAVGVTLPIADVDPR